MEILKVPISDIEVWKDNPRNIKTEDFERLKRQIQELGVYKPLVCIQENGKYITLGGNMRLRALRELNHSEVDVSIVEAKTEAMKIKYALSDNDRAGEYDEQKLAELVYPHLDEIRLEDFKIDMGEPISLKDVIEDYGPNMDGSEDEIPEIDDSPAITKTGDLFTLGKHRLLCGDATKEEDVKRLMNGKKADMVFTDPPYNINLGHIGHSFNNYDDNQSMDAYSKLVEIAIRNILIFADNAPFYIFSSNRDIALYQQLIEKLGLHYHQLLIWAKHSGMLGNSDYIQNYEALHYAYYGKHRKVLSKGLLACELVGLEENFETIQHPTSKPVVLIKKFLINHTFVNENIIDLFLGSGTTLIACEKLNRICMGMEISEKYCDVVITRFSNFTGIPEEEIRATVEHGQA